jgi:hypothetical protein
VLGAGKRIADLPSGGKSRGGQLDKIDQAESKVTLIRCVLKLAAH